MSRVDLLEIFLQMVREPPVIETVETHQVILTDYMTGVEPVSGKPYQQFVIDNAAAWQKAWRNQFGENTVMRTDAKWDGMVRHLGYEPASVQHGVRSCLRQVITTDDDLIKASQDRLRDVETIADASLTGRQLASLELAREISRRLTGWTYNPVRGVHAAIIPPASDRVRTAGMYGRSTVEIYISADQLQHGRSTVDTVIHELAHHTTGAEDGEEAHNAEMTRLAGQVVEATAKGYFDNFIGAPDFGW